MQPSGRDVLNRVDLVDRAAVAFGLVAAPMLRLIAKRREALVRFQRFADRNGFQLRSNHYYEPTYSEDALPADTTRERHLPGIDLNAEGQLALLRHFRFGDELRRFPAGKTEPGVFGWSNPNYQYGDGEIYYSMIRHQKPARIVEIGSGNSTLLAVAAIAANRADDPGYACELVCVEPYEMPWLSKQPLTLVRERVEHVDRGVFSALGQNDILFIDSSHIIRPYGDVLCEFSEIVPSLAPGVWVHVHDIFTPRDYPERWLRAHRRLWNEQYLLEAYLAHNSRTEVMCAVNWLKHNHFDALAAACPLLGEHPGHEPGAFWFRMR